jgi:hypothetical protein
VVTALRSSRLHACAGWPVSVSLGHKTFATVRPPPGYRFTGRPDVETLLKLVLVLVVVWVALEILELVLKIVLWLLDRL